MISYNDGMNDSKIKRAKSIAKRLQDKRKPAYVGKHNPKVYIRSKVKYESQEN
jgi:hypothetical protein